MEEKIYVNGIIVKEKTFDNGGTQLKMSVKTDEFVKQLSEVTENGWANLIVSRRKEPSETGITHYVVVDTWKPNQKSSSMKPEMVIPESDSDSGLPF
tara:strand:- start:218 stop:508 length:291 start_codon:yes stop_codon:yes gene_type:complete